jgi:hypothetical protein
MRWRAVTSLLAGITIVTAAACGSTTAGTFHPEGASLPKTSVSPGIASTSGADGLTWPPFGADVHVVMPSWLPGSASQNQAVIAAKDFLLAYLYADYTGGKDDRWTSDVSGTVVSGLRDSLDVPGITTQSFQGTITFSHLRAFADPTTQGDIDVSECFDNAHSQNTSLATGKVLPDNTPADQHYYQNTDVLAQTGGWHVVSVYPVVYYPRAEECGP